MNPKKIHYLLLYLLCIALYGNCTYIKKDGCIESDADSNKISLLEKNLKSYLAEKEGRIGVAVIFDGRDTIAVNGDDDFELQSVFKFPLALAVANHIDLKDSSLDETIAIPAEELHEDTWSPMLSKYGKRDLRLFIRELLEWSLKESDNNAADILLKYIGNPGGLSDMMRIMDLPKNISIEASEADIHKNPELSKKNIATPLAMAELFEKFLVEMKGKRKSFSEIAMMIEQCNTGKDRLAGALAETGAIIGHKTGTGFETPEGGISALNDCGYVVLPDGNHYSIAVFIADSPLGIVAASEIISDISGMVYDTLGRK